MLGWLIGINENGERKELIEALRIDRWHNRFALVAAI